MRQQRLARLAYAMQERGITQVIISEDRNLYYYLGLCPSRFRGQ